MHTFMLNVFEDLQIGENFIATALDGQKVFHALQHIFFVLGWNSGVPEYKMHCKSRFKAWIQMEIRLFKAMLC